MFKMNENMPDLLEDFRLPFGGKLNLENRWVQLAKFIPWDKAEAKYVRSFESLENGQEAYSVRVALGSLIIKERLGLSDRETTQQIMENLYLQFFIGKSEYVDHEPPFHHSLMTHFRERLGADIIAEVNDWVAQEALKAEQEKSAQAQASSTKDKDKDKDDNDPDDGQLTMLVGESLTVPEVAATTAKKARKPMKILNVLPPQSEASSNITNKGTLMLDATCAPADIKYPTDLGLLNHAQEILEGIIDTLHHPHIGQLEKPRTYRQ